MSAGATSFIGSHIRSYLDIEGASGHSSVVGSTKTYSVASAAYANAGLIHSLDFDDMGGAGGHPSATLVGACLATCEELDLTGEEFISAYAVGYETTTAIQRSISMPKPFQPTSVLAPIGAALACCWLRGLSVDQMTTAMSIAATQSGGSRQSFGSELKPLQMANAARVATVAALLASAGCRGDDEVLEGPEGLFVCYGRSPSDVEKVATYLEGPLMVGEAPTRIRKGAYYVAKPWPTNGDTQDGIAAFFRAVRGRNLTEDQIESIRVEVPAHNGIGIADARRMRWGLDGKFSLRYCIAAGALDGEVAIESFTDEAMTRIMSSRLYKNMKIESVPTDDPSKVFGIQDDHGRWLGARVIINLKDGSQLIGEALGDSDGYVGGEEMESKYRRCASALLNQSETDELLSNVKSFDGQVVRQALAVLRKSATE